jgi:hypothetical protein
MVILKTTKGSATHHFKKEASSFFEARLQFHSFVVYLYSRRESNPHVLRHWILNPARLPVPPLEQVDGKNT